jgi:hypothetical protein
MTASQAISGILRLHPQVDGGPTCCIAFCGERATICATFGEYGRADLCDDHWKELRGRGLSGHAMTDFWEIALC